MGILSKIVDSAQAVGRTLLPAADIIADYTLPANLSPHAKDLLRVLVNCAEEGLDALHEKELERRLQALGDDQAQIVTLVSGLQRELMPLLQEIADAQRHYQDPALLQRAITEAYQNHQTALNQIRESMLQAVHRLRQQMDVRFDQASSELNRHGSKIDRQGIQLNQQSRELEKHTTLQLYNALKSTFPEAQIFESYLQRRHYQKAQKFIESLEIHGVNEITNAMRLLLKVSEGLPITQEIENVLSNDHLREQPAWKKTISEFNRHTQLLASQSASSTLRSQASQVQSGMRLRLNSFVWQVESQLRVGGMAQVWRVKRKTKRGIRRGLLKLRRPEMSGPEYIEAFRREQRILSMLDEKIHPNITNILDFGFNDIIRADCIILEDVAGEDLQERSERVEITVQESLEIMRGVLTGLRYLHQHNILHNDLKAANIVMRDDTGRPVIIDFGNSIILNEVTPNSPLVFGGAPEQSRSIFDEKNDIYKLGQMWLQILGSDAWSKLNPAQSRLVSLMCHADHNQRPTSKKALDQIRELIEGPSQSKKYSNRRNRSSNQVSETRSTHQRVTRRVSDRPADTSRAHKPNRNDQHTVSSARVKKNRSHKVNTHDSNQTLMTAPSSLIPNLSISDYAIRARVPEKFVRFQMKELMLLAREDETLSRRVTERLTAFIYNGQPLPKGQLHINDYCGKTNRPRDQVKKLLMRIRSDHNDDPILSPKEVSLLNERLFPQQSKKSS